MNFSLLTTRTMWFFRATKPAAVFLLLALVGCTTFLAMKGVEEIKTGILFNHELHLGRGFTCAVCHQFYSYYDPHAPDERVCAFCHTIGSHESPTKECNRCHIRSDYTVNIPSLPSFKDSKFQHKVHLEASITCLACHQGMDTSRNHESMLFPSMKDCLACHARKQSPRTCATCHNVWREDKKPESHDDLWLKKHGSIAIGEFERLCDYCHTNKSYCAECHMAEPPQSHTLFFKNRGHGFYAETDRMECLPCHQQDFCLECHNTEHGVKPRTHIAGFGGRRPYMHCVQCHFPEGSGSGCSTCHNGAVIQSRHREITEERSLPIPSFVPSISLNCLNLCHPYERIPPTHPLGALNNNDCLRCHTE